MAIIGASGAGKTIFAKILTKNTNFRYDGNIFLNNFNIKNIDESVIIKNIIYLNSDNTILKANLMDNITFFNKNANLEKVKDILNLMNLNKNLFSDVENLSEGQKQKINLARILMEKENKILILDEALNNLDIEESKKIRKLLMEKSKIYIEISHNLNEEKNKFNKILNLKNVHNNF